MITDTKPPLDEALLKHYGIKGMKWGVRRTDEQLARAAGRKLERANRPKRTPEEKKALAKKVAIGTGILLAAGGAAYVTAGLVNSGTISMGQVAASGAAKAGAAAVKAITEEPNEIILATRGKNKGYQFLKKSGDGDPLQEYEKSGVLNGDSSEAFSRYGDNNEKVAARFKDPKGRRDSAGRVIMHELVVPGIMSEGLNDIEDVKTKIWPMVEKDYDSFYESSLERD